MKHLLILSLLCLLILPLSAQKKRVKAGVKACRTGHYEKAITDLTDALEEKGLLGRDELPAAYYYRARARLLLLDQLRKTGSNQGLAAYAGDHREVFEDLKDAAATDRGKYANRIREDYRLLFDLLLTEALENLTYARRDNIPELRREQALRDAKHLLRLARRIDDDDYLLHDLTGRLHFAQKAYEPALIAYRKAIKAFERRPPARPDLLFAYAFYRKALLHYRYRHQEPEGQQDTPSKYDIDQALNSVAEGLKTLDREYRRLRNDHSLIAPLRKYFSEQYEAIRSDLYNLQLDLYLQAPDRYNEALKVFAQAIDNQPFQYAYHIAYAQLLELSDRERAAAIYREAIQMEPERAEAYFNMGAMYLNEASRLIAQARQEERLKSYAELMSEAKALLEKARPPLEKAHLAEPENLTVLNALIQIAAVLEDREGYEVYRNAKDERLSR